MEYVNLSKAHISEQEDSHQNRSLWIGNDRLP